MSGRDLEPNPLIGRLGVDTTLEAMTRRLRCDRCGARAAETRVIVRDLKMGLRNMSALPIVVYVVALVLVSPCAFAQGLALNSPGDRRPLDIEADNGIEWRQDQSVYIARMNARATRGGATLYGDTLTAHYRPVGPDQKKPPDSLGGSTEIYRIEANGNVRLNSETQIVYGDRGVYKMDSATAVFTGEHLKLVTQRDTVTARDSLEWFDNEQIGIARGEAKSVRDTKQVAADVLIAHVVKPADGPSRIDRIDAQDHVVVTTPTEIARGASGVYNVDAGIVTLARDVTITRGDNVLKGQYGIVNLNTNISRLLSAPPGDFNPRRAPVTVEVRPGTGNPPPGPAPHR